MSVRIVLDGTQGCGIKMTQYIGSKAHSQDISPGGYTAWDWKPDPRLQPQRIVFTRYDKSGAEELLDDSTFDWRGAIGDELVADCGGLSWNKKSKAGIMFKGSGPTFGSISSRSLSTSYQSYNLPNPFSNCVNISTGGLTISICPSMEKKE